VPDDGPAVIAALLDQVQLIAAAWAVLVFPKIAVIVEGEPFLAALADGPDLGQGTVLAGKGIAGRRFAVPGDAEDLAQMGVERLRHAPGKGTAGVAIADGDIEQTILADGDAPAAAGADARARIIGRLGPGAEDHLHIAQRIG